MSTLNKSKSVSETVIEYKDIVAPHFHQTTKDVFKHTYTHYWYSGGRGSAKSSKISIDIILLLIQNKDVNALILRKVGTTLKNTVYNQILWAIDKLHLLHLFQARLSPLEITYMPTGQKIYFRGGDDPVKLKSIKPRKGYVGLVWFEELSEFHGMEEVRNILQSANRGGSKYWNFYSYNPPKSRGNWVNVECMQKSANKTLHHSTYESVPPEWLGAEFIYEAELLKQRNPRAYEHEYLGIATGTGGNVFENIKEDIITDEQIRQFDRILNGVDWGFYPDPWAFVRCYYHAGSQTLYIFDEAVAWKKGNRDTAKIIKDKGVSNTERIIADSAEPKSVKDYQDYGLSHTRGADKSQVKGEGSVAYSMKWLASLKEIVIDSKRCPKAYAEFNGYEYERNKSGEIITGYPDKNNHFIDAVRYAASEIWRRRERGYERLSE